MLKVGWMDGCTNNSQQDPVSTEQQISTQKTRLKKQMGEAAFVAYEKEQASLRNARSLPFLDAPPFSLQEKEENGAGGPYSFQVQRLISSS